jgi:hypothetical protein
VYVLQQADKKAATRELAATRQAEQERASTRGAAKCANIRHIWQLESAGESDEMPESARSMVQQIRTFIKQEYMVERLSQLDTLQLPKTLRQRSAALDGAPLY